MTQETSGIGSENQIRDRLAADLHVLEPNLELVQTNYYVSNEHGSSGFIDILARDSAGMFVAIELKKSASTSREAMHEVGKYIDLLTRSRGVPAHRVRAMIVSTDWRELLVPFSYYVASAEFPITGLHLELDHDGTTPKQATPVTPIESPSERTLTEVQRLVHCSARVATVWEEIQSALRSIGVAEMVGRVIRNERADEALVLTIGTIQNENLRRQLLEAVSSGPFADEFDDINEVATEELVFARLQELLPETLLGVCYPDKTGALIEEHGWTDSHWLRSGIFTDEILFPDSDLMDMTQGWSEGLTDGRFHGSARPQNQLAWGKTVAGVRRAMRFTPGWQEIVDLWLEERIPNPSRHDVGFHIYNLGDFIQTLAHGFGTDRFSRLVPDLAVVLQAAPPDGIGLIGKLTWDGTEVDVRKAISSVYGRPSDWGTARWSYSVGHTDIRLLEALHLRHTIWEVQTRDDGVPDLLVARERKLVRLAGRVGAPHEDWYQIPLKPLFEFIEAHFDQLAEIAEKLQASLVIIDDTATQLHILEKDDDHW